MSNFQKIAGICRVAALAIVIAASALSVTAASVQAAQGQAARGQAARGPDFPDGLRIQKARFSAYSRWSTAMVREGRQSQQIKHAVM